ncbi:hypothetical protein [Bacillus sp. UNCCL81]|uniref:hypothetical protein n=1 Tax=Bacillus sp. UNCCL81 TaxID=1502755 RepID=UPI0003F981B0|nr:hypothetical protein [Bacillus sp. UNCCL81]SFD61265.1 hypothetical protein SAMN02799633_04284 [Bacillus sp. UNCCL81]
MNRFSFQEYKEIINRIKKTHQVLDFSDIDDFTNNFAIIRHDVEFSVERAHALAQLENKLGVCSSYFFQIRNNAYNIFSKENIEKIQSIAKMGHKIGIHVHLGMLKNIKYLERYISDDITVMQNFLDIPIDRFSFHRPTKEVLLLNLKMNGLINAYEDRFFEYRNKEDNLENLRVKYFADSMHRWDYGYPDSASLQLYPKLQLLVHPFSWTRLGYDYFSNINVLIDEKSSILSSTIDLEMAE